MAESTPNTGADYGIHQTAMSDYLREGETRALALGNRGPIRFDADGRLAADIVDAYARVGFYVFTGVLSAEELDDLRSDVEEMWSRLPVSRGAEVDALGRPALGSDLRAPTVQWARPLSDPLGGTDKANGRHPAKMFEPEPAADAPRFVCQLVLGSLQFSDACLRIYAHPQLLKVSAAINGDDFAPFNEAVWRKEPGLGASVAWHQDGTTHWDSPDLDWGTHGFNFMAQIYGCTAANAVWVVPGSHAQGKVDIAALVESAGSDRLPDAMPLICDAGDVAICNRQAVHGSFANTGTDLRVTINFGFHRRRSLIGVEGGGIHNRREVYDAARIRERSRVIAYAIDARRQRFPDEEPYVYQPFAGEEEAYRWNDAARADLKDYNLLDLGI
ncbi:MAG: phytanoyl-CoA dioxygenase [Pseudomonadales bacterium]|nr:phytanoyl-CoA dioxygenase family protein [Pseudomonadales bacterium]NIX08854.1 phytanoyl-CoA dioxygenase [Pseudomonadales bacterium]